MIDSSNNLLDLVRSRDLLKRSLFEYLHTNGFLEVTSSTITSLTGACETIETVFALPFFESRAHLAQTAQLQLERMVKLLQRKVWAWDRSFREEPRVTTRHLVEFCLLEVESPGYKLADIMATKEALLKHCISNIANGTDVPDLLARRLPYLTSVQFPLHVCEYTEAVRILSARGVSPDAGGLGMREEVELLAHFGNQPFFIVHYPAAIKYFNMRRMPDPDWVYSVDLIAPPFGEISGGAEREDEYDKVVRNLKSSKMWSDLQRLWPDEDHFEWYLSLWEDGSPGPRGGFGMGFERLVGFFTGIDDIRRCTEFPRNKETIFP